MDREFTIPAHSNTATASPTHPIFAPPPLKDPPSAPARIRRCTHALQNPYFHDGYGLGLSHDPAIWMLRASLLLSLGYPELAASDAYKARVLVSGALELLGGDRKCGSTQVLDIHHPDNVGLKALITFSFFLITNFHTQWDPALRTSWTESTEPITLSNLREATLRHLSLVEQQTYIILIISLQHCNAFAENLELCEEAAAKFGQTDGHPFWGKETRSTLKELLDEKRKEAEAHPMFSGSELDVVDAVRGGGVLACRYPWMGEDLLERTTILAEINEEMNRASNGKCRVGRSQIRDRMVEHVPQDGSDELSQESLGIFATVDIPSSTTVFIEEQHTTSITSDPSRCPVCCGPLPSESAAKAKTISDHQAVPEESRHRVGLYHLPCCNQAFCSRKCGDIAVANFHRPLCGKTFSFPSDIGLSPAKLQHNRRSRHTAAYLLQRVLALAVQGTRRPGSKDFDKADTPNESRADPHTSQRPLAHPLEHSLIKRLTVNYHTPRSNDPSGNESLPSPAEVKPWSLADSVIHPQEMLQKMGIDIYGDLRFDAWVLRTIALRISNNQHGGLLFSTTANNTEKEEDEDAAYVQALHPLFVFFNHSCEPNVSYSDNSASAAKLATVSTATDTNAHQTKATTSRLIATTNTDITAGSELCISYLDVSHLKGRPRHRGRKLATWVGERGCGCELCVRERNEEKREGGEGFEHG
ncbi:MAG: hypothetical protein M1831_005438 [Alyxoria varia]|nr:MAG: hypothetical protein M1831_005438 [Alyxoria varia]